MAPITHSISGATLGSTGKEKHSRFGRSAFILAAVAPDSNFGFALMEFER